MVIFNYKNTYFILQCIIIIITYNTNAYSLPKIFLQFGHSNSVTSLSFNYNGKLLASASKDNTIKLWEIKTGTLLRTYYGHSKDVRTVCFSPDGSIIASGGDDQGIKIWDTKSGNLIRVIRGHSGSINTICFSPDGIYIISGSSDNTIKVWDTNSGKLIKSLSGHQGFINSLCCTNDGLYIISGGSDASIKIWNLQTNKLVRTLKKHISSVNTVIFESNSKSIISCSNDNTIIIWNFDTGSIVQTLDSPEKHLSYINTVACSFDGKYIVSGSADKTVKIWNMNTGDLIKTISGYKGHKESINAVCFSPDGKFILSASDDSSIKIWNVKTGKLHKDFSGNTNSINEIKFSPDGKWLASAYADKTIKIWNIQNGSLQKDNLLLEHTKDVNTLCYSSDGKFIVSGGNDKKIIIWNLESKTINNIKSKAAIHSIKLSSDNKNIFANSNQDILKIDIKTKKPSLIYKGNTSDVLSIDLSPDDRYIAAGYTDNSVIVWNVSSASIFKKLTAHKSYVTVVRFSPDGKYIVSGSSDNSLIRWNFKDNDDYYKVIYGHVSTISSIAFSPDRKYIVSGSWDNTVKLWNLNSGKLLYTFIAKSSSVQTVDYDKSGKYIAAGFQDQTIKIWRTSDNFNWCSFASFPGNEWIAWQDDNILYNSSLDADQYASIRFDNNNFSVFPIKYYNNELKKPDWINLSLNKNIIKIKPKRFQLLWDRTQNKVSKLIIIITLLLLLLLFILKVQKKKYDPFEQSKKFFSKACFSKIDLNPDKFLSLYNEDSIMSGIVCIWNHIEDQNNSVNSEFIKKINKLNHKIKLYIIYDNQKPSAFKLQKFRENKRDVIPIALSILIKNKNITDSNEIQKTLWEIEEPFLTRPDPYFTLSPVNDPIWFFGRKEELERIPQLLIQGQHIAVIGLRKVGKTSILKQIQLRFVNIPTVHINMQSVEVNSLKLFEKILKSLFEELKLLKIKKISNVKPVLEIDDFTNQITKYFKNWKKSGHDEPFLIIIDEIDKFFPDVNNIERDKILTEYIKFSGALGGLAQTDQSIVTLVAGYRPDINRKSQFSQELEINPMFKQFKEIFLGNFNEADSLEMIKEIGLWKNIIWDDESINRVFDYCGGHPLITRLFASIACGEGTIKNIDIKQVDETADDIIKKININSIGSYFKGGLYELLREEEKILVQLIFNEIKNKLSKKNISNKEPLVDIQVMINEVKNKLAEYNISNKDAIASIELFGIIKSKEMTLSFTSYLFIKWLQGEM